MTDMFVSVLNMSLTASYVIASLIVIRFCLKRAPKAISYGLWAVAGFRLLLPFSFESAFSLLPFQAQPIPQTVVLGEQVSFRSAASAALQAVGDAANGGLDTITVQLGKTAEGSPVTMQAYHSQVWMALGSYLWLIGIALLLTYSVASIVLLNRRLAGARCLRDNIYEAENLRTPFVLGFIHPKIYIPAGLLEEEKVYIILHEQTHIRRLDHIVKLAAFLILCLHWFNPLVWIAFLLMSTDMEMSCDERVLKEMGEGIKNAYSTSLLSLAAGRYIVNGSPLAFGEGNIRGRIKNVLNFRKPAAWIIAVSTVLAVILGIGLAANRTKDMEPDLSLLNIKNLAVIAHQADELLVSRMPGEEEDFRVPAETVAGYLDGVSWEEQKTDALPSGLSPALEIEWNEDQELQFYESEPLMAVVRLNEQRRCYTIGQQDYQKILALLAAAHNPQSIADTSLEPVPVQLSEEQSIGVDMVQLDYASNDIVIFHDYFGLFVYDLNGQKIIRNLDLKSIGCGATQGDDYCEVLVSADGNTVQLHPMSSDRMYVYSISENSLLKTAYVPMEDRFQGFVDITEAIGSQEIGSYSYQAVRLATGEYGYLYTYDWTVATLSYVQGDMMYALFDMAAKDSYFIAGKEYKYKRKLTGTFPNASSATTITVYTNDEDLTFEEAAKSIFSSSSKDVLDIYIEDMK